MADVSSQLECWPDDAHLYAWAGIVGGEVRITIFDRRERAFENKIVRELEMNFRVRAARNRRLGYWAAEQLQLSSREDYAAEIVRCGAVGGDEAVFQRLRSDLNAAGVAISDHRLKAKMSLLLDRAAEDLPATRQ